MWVVVAVLRGDRFGALLPVLVSACAILAIFSAIRATQRTQARGSFQPPGASSISPLPGACTRISPSAASARRGAQSTPTPAHRDDPASSLLEPGQSRW